MLETNMPIRFNALLATAAIVILFIASCKEQRKTPGENYVQAPDSIVNAAQAQGGEGKSNPSPSSPGADTNTPPVDASTNIVSPRSAWDGNSDRVPFLTGGGGINRNRDFPYCGDGKVKPGECSGWLTSDANPELVAFQFIDLRSEPGAEKVVDGDDEAKLITLNPPHTSSFLDKTLNSIIVATNGILDTGANPNSATDYVNECPLPYMGLSGDRYFVMHDDLEITNSVFHKYFPFCPRVSDLYGAGGCHVFHWTPAKHYPQELTFRSFDIEAILYDQGEVVYQYTDLTKENGGNIERGAGSTTGIQVQNGSRFFQYACDTAGTLPDQGNLALRLSFCYADCPASVCGDGVVGQNEVCDDGDLVAGDGCSATCTKECGDGVLDTDATDGYSEQCDTTVDTSTCDSDCTLPVCGDGHANGALEQCDDGNGVSGDGCTAECKFACGDGITDTDPSDGYFEQCDAGGETINCTAICTVSFCGDLYANQTAGEECDDGNHVAGDGCFACTLECGNSIVDSDASDGYSEECDTGGESATCNLDCTLSRCGDGKQNAAAGEECDDVQQTPECDADCTFARCGDGYTNPEANEQCDTGVPSATCDIDCTLAICGDGVINPLAGEICDTGGESSTCDADCTLPICGDGVINTSAGEQCEPPNVGNCNAICLINIGD